MNGNTITGINDEWPSCDLERVSHCPLCGGAESEIAHEDVQDWAFHAAPGKWNYWKCLGCDSLYLNPRPNRKSIGRAYVAYYTHADKTGIISVLKRRWKNERLSVLFGRTIEPRLHLPSWFQGFVRRKARKVSLPFGWHMLAALIPGRLADVGCGAGAAVHMAKQLGWDAVGIELDSDAVLAASRTGIFVQQGGYELLKEQRSTYDCLLCSHVLEHVHDPLDMLATLRDALKPGGVLFLSLPNANSDALKHFGINWRGLEVPRHLVIPAQHALHTFLENLGFSVESHADSLIETARESYRIARRDIKCTSQDRASAKKLQRELQRDPDGADFIKLICRKM